MARTSPTGRAERFHQRGFTLIEILVVLAIAALMMASISFTAFHRDPGFEGQVEALVTALRGLRAQARLEGETRQALFDLQSRKVLLPDQVLTIDAAEEIVVTSARHQLLDDRKIGISFYADGSSSGGMIRLSAGAEILGISVNWISGKIDRRILSRGSSG